MRNNFFDDFNDSFNGNDNKKLFPFINHEDDKECLEWLNSDLDSKLRSRMQRLESVRKLDSMFKGLPYYGSAKSHDEDDRDMRKPPSIYNFIYEMVEAKVSQRSRHKPSIAVIPNSTETDDENRAEGSKQILTALAQTLNLDEVFSSADKINFLSGQSYIYVKFNKDIGGFNKKYENYKKDGLFLEDEDGEVIPEIMNGDIDIKVLGVDRCFEQAGKKRWEDVNDISIIGWTHIDELSSEYPDKKIVANSNSHLYFSESDRLSYSNCCLVTEYYHKPTKFFKEGIYVKFTRDAILEKTTYPYKHNKLPIIFDTDIDVQGELAGRPFVSNIERLQRLHDMASASLARSFAISSSPKWVYAKGSIDPNKLTNTYSSLEFKGPLAPVLTSFNGINSASFSLLDWAEKGIEKMSTVYGISRGAPPPGIKAAIALQFLDEQEQQRESRGMAKRQARIISTNKMLLALVQQFYTKEDGRILKILGEDNTHIILDLQTMEISGEVDIRIENSSSLGDSKAGRLSAILDINLSTQNDPVFKKEEIIQMLELGNDKRFKQNSLAGLKSAEYKISKILRKEPCPEARPWDDFVTEYPLFIQELRKREYKGEDPEIIEKLSNYILGLEYQMWEKSQINPAMKMRIQSFQDYPVFFKVPIDPPQPQIPQEVQIEQSKAPIDVKSVDEEIKQQQELTDEV